MVGESSVRSRRVSQVSSTSSNSTGGWICCRHLSLFFCCHPLLTLSLQSLLLPATIIILYSKPLKRFHSFVGTCDMRPTWKLSIVSAPYWDRPVRRQFSNLAVSILAECNLAVSILAVCKLAECYLAEIILLCILHMHMYMHWFADIIQIPK